MTHQPKKTVRRQEILHALAAMLEAPIGTRITTAALAAEVGFSEAALYRHFPSKARIYEGLIDFTEDTLFTRIRTILNEDATPQNHCYQILLLTLTFVEKNPGISRILTGEALTGLPDHLYKRVSGLFDRIETQLKQILREGEYRQELHLQLTTSASTELMLAVLEGKIRQFVKSGFTRSPTYSWMDQWQALSFGIFR